MPQHDVSPKRTGLLAEAQQQAEAAAATLIERKFKEPANLEVFSTDEVPSESALHKRACRGRGGVVNSVDMGRCVVANDRVL